MSLLPPGPSPLVPGYRLDRYELLCPIAEGGMAQVWVARLRGKHGFERLVAIKTILPRYASDSHFQHMFLDEARIASGIEHTNVAQILDLGDERGVLFLAMEWIDGDALTKLYRALEKQARSIPPGVLLRILADACGGLHAAHELRDKDGALLGVVHRDVSPQNILVSARGVAKVIDFGIAKARDRLAGETSTGFLKGKVQYMAPEQALGVAVDRRADVWAIGAILYHYLTGRPPYDGPNQLATLHLLTEGKPPAPMPASVAPQVVEVTLRALAHSADRRYATAAELQAALEWAMIAANLATTTADVAAYCETHVADRAAKRREAVELALATAAERERMNALLRPEAPDGADSISSGPPRGRAVSLPTAVAGPESSQMRAATVIDPLPFDRTPVRPSVPTSPTLGRAAMESTIDPELPTRRPGLVPVAVIGALGVLLGVVATVALRSGGEMSTAASAAPPATLSPSPPPLPVVPPPPSVDPVGSAAPTAAASATTATPAATAHPPARSHAAPPASSPPRGPTKIPQVLDNGF